MTTNRLAHKNPKAEELVLAEEAKTHLASSAALQFMVTLLTVLRELNLPWWTPTQRRKAYTATERMRDLKDRRVVSARIIQELTGAFSKAALKMDPALAASNIDLALEKDENGEADKSDKDFENAFSPEELVLYGDACKFYADFREAMPWEDSSAAHKELVVKLIECFLKLGILTHHAVFSAVPSDIRQSKMTEMQTRIIDELLKKERDDPKVPYHAVDIMAIATPQFIVDATLLIDLIGIFQTAEKAMGFEPQEVPSETELDEKSSSSPKA